MKRSRIKSLIERKEKLYLLKSYPFIFVLIATNALFLRIYFYNWPVEEGAVQFVGTLDEEARIFDRWQYFSVDGYFLKTDSEQVYQVGDRLQIKGLAKERRLGNPSITVVGHDQLKSKLFKLRKALDDQIKKALPEPQASLLAGIVLGIKQDLSEDFKNKLIKTGTIHVVVVSGYNISVVAGILISLARFIHRRIAILLAFAGIAFYTVLVGADPPAVRAAIMGSLALYAVFLGRQSFSLYFLFLAAFFMIFFQPIVLLNIGFQLSFLATLGIISFQEKFASLLSQFPFLFKEDLATTLAAQSLVIPVLFYHFGQVSFISPLVNGLILWIIPIATIFGFLFLFTSLIVWPFALLISWVIWGFLSLFAFLVDFFSRLPFTNLDLKEGNLVILIGYYFLLLTILIYLRYGKDFKKQ